MINEAEAYASRTLLGAVGSEALSLLQAAAQTQSPEAMKSPARIDWRLTDEMWQQLIHQNADGSTRLAGTAAAILLQGQTVRMEHEMSATGAAARFQSIFHEYISQPNLTGQYLYWTSVSDVLSQRPLTVIDPKAAGRQHVWIGEPPPSAAFMPMPMPVPPAKDARERE